MDKKELAVVLDSQGVSYLRLGSTSSGNTQLVLNNGKSVDVVQMDKATVKSRDLQVVHNANILEAVKTLLHPLSKSVTISKTAETELNKLLNDKELTASMATKIAVAPAPTTTGPKPVKVGTRGPKPVKASTKAPKVAKTAKADGRSLDNATIKPLVKQNPCREGTFCHAQVEALLHSKTVAEAQAALDASGQNPRSRRVEVAWAVKNGYIKVSQD